MPIEIRELVIRATVNPKADATGDYCGPPAGKAGEKPKSGAHASVDDGVVQSCVREVLRILEDKRER